MEDIYDVEGKIFGEKLFNLRKEKVITQEDLADLLNVSRQSVSKWESGVAFPEMEKLLLLCNFFNVTIDCLLATQKERLSESKTTNSDYAAFEKKRVNIFFNDREVQGIAYAGIIKVYIQFIVFEQKNKTGLVFTDKIRNITERIKPKKMSAIPVKSIEIPKNPFDLFIGHCCNIRMKNAVLFGTTGGFYHADIISVTPEKTVVKQNDKTSIINTADILYLLEAKL